MANEERDHLLKEIDEIRTRIETLRPGMYEQQIELGAESELRRSKLTRLRKELARDMELLHADHSY
jgi:hypothetical protein